MGTLIRHAGPSAPVFPLAVAMIESSFRALLVAAVGAAALPEPGFGAAGGTAIALPPIALLAEPEHRLASGAEANPLTKNDLALIHARRETGLDNGDRSWQVRTSSMCGYLLKVARLEARPLQRPGTPRVPAFDETLYLAVAQMMIDGGLRLRSR